MKGIVKLIPLSKEDIKEGMKVIWNNKIKTVLEYEKETEDTDSVLFLEGSNESLDENEIKQLVIEYLIVVKQSVKGGTNEGHIKKQIPLQQSDWKEAIELIGKEIEFKLMIGQPHIYFGKIWCKLIKSKPILYTEKEFKNLMLEYIYYNDMGSGDDEVDKNLIENWLNNKKK